MGSKPTGQFGEVEQENGVDKLQDKIMGPDYDYSRRIKTPQQMSMSGKGTWSALGNNINGLLGYIELMVVGECKGLGKCANTTGRALGSKFFVDTPLKCTDKKTRQKVKRSLYINNVPDGSIPFISNMSNVYFDTFKGLLPGLMSNASQLNPMQILLSFVSGPTSTCQEITMETIDSADRRGTESAYVLNKDIELMNPAWFSSAFPKPSSEQLRELTPEEEEEIIVTSDKEDDEGSEEAFSGMNGNSSLKGTRIDYSKMPNDILIKFYYTCLGLLGLYFLFKILMKKNKK